MYYIDANAPKIKGYNTRAYRAYLNATRCHIPVPGLARAARGNPLVINQDDFRQFIGATVGLRAATAIEGC